MQDIIELLRRPGTSVAVVGATDDREKYGSVIYRDLKHKGFRVYPVNPSRATVDGDPAFPTLSALPERPTIVDYVVPPAVTLRILQGDHDRIPAWIQPGAESPAVLAHLQEHEYCYIAGACIMVESRLLG